MQQSTKRAQTTSVHQSQAGALVLTSPFLLFPDLLAEANPT